MLQCVLNWVIENFSFAVIFSGLATLFSWIALHRSSRKDSKSFELSEFDDEYGSSILLGRNEVKAFIRKIAIFVNELNQKNNENHSEKILEMTNKYHICTENLTEATTYFDKHYPQKKKIGDLSPHALEIDDALASILDTLHAVNLKSTNWDEAEYKLNIKSVRKGLSSIHSLVSEQKRNL